MRPIYLFSPITQKNFKVVSGLTSTSPELTFPAALAFYHLLKEVSEMREKEHRVLWVIDDVQEGMRIDVDRVLADLRSINEAAGMLSIQTLSPVSSVNSPFDFFGIGRCFSQKVMELITEPNKLTPRTYDVYNALFSIFTESLKKCPLCP